MKKRFLSSRTTVLFIALCVAFSACKKNREEKNTTQPTAEQVNSLKNISTPYLVLNGAIEALFAGSFPDDGSEDASGRKYGCATVTATPGGANNEFPKTVVIDFGTGCTLRGYQGQGSIRFSLTQWIFIPGTEIIPEFHEFHVNGYKIEGDYKVTTLSATEFKVDIMDGIVTAPEGTIYHFKGTQYYEQTAGANTAFKFSDDVYAITGSGTVTTPTGSAALEITTPLVKEITCTNIVSGLLNIKAQNMDANLNFGDGTCDNQGTLIIGPFSFPVTLPF